MTSHFSKENNNKCVKTFKNKVEEKLIFVKLVLPKNIYIFKYTYVFAVSTICL